MVYIRSTFTNKPKHKCHLQTLPKLISRILRPQNVHFCSTPSHFLILQTSLILQSVLHGSMAMVVVLSGLQLALTYRLLNAFCSLLLLLCCSRFSVHFMFFYLAVNTRDSVSLSRCEGPRFKQFVLVETSG